MDNRTCRQENTSGHIGKSDTYIALDELRGQLVLSATEEESKSSICAKYSFKLPDCGMEHTLQHQVETLS